MAWYLSGYSGKTYKRQHEDARKARAGDSTGWNASFVRQDTVVDALADRLGVSKGDILDREGVSQAHGGEGTGNAVHESLVAMHARTVHVTRACTSAAA